MKKTLSISLIALLAASAAQAQFTATDDIADRVDAVEDSVNDEFEKADDAERFGQLNVPQGWDGSIFMTLSNQASTKTTGVDTDMEAETETDAFDIALGGRFTYGAGAWVQTLNFTADYSEADKGSTETQGVSVSYDISRYFNDRFYAFTQLTGNFDGIGLDNLDSANGFWGIGLGYRVIATEDTTWRIQGGPGWNYSRTGNGIKDTDTSEAGFAASSRFYTRLTDTAILTNDTDFIGSENASLVTNDLGMTFPVTDTLSTRVGLRTEWSNDDAAAIEDYSNKLTAAFVFSF